MFPGKRIEVRVCGHSLYLYRIGAEVSNILLPCVSVFVGANPCGWCEVRLQGASTGGEEERENRYSFSGFMLTVDAARDGGFLGAAALRRNPVGNFSLYGDTLAKFDERCPHAVTHTSSIRKTIVEVQWTAPVQNSGCVIFR